MTWCIAALDFDSSASMSIERKASVSSSSRRELAGLSKERQLMMQIQNKKQELLATSTTPGEWEAWLCMFVLYFDVISTKHYQLKHKLVELTITV